MSKPQTAPLLEPFERLGSLVARARKAKIHNANAMAVSTVSSSSGWPSSRFVLLKDFEPERKVLTFYTNYESQKGRELLDGDGKVACLFYWRELGLQVRVQGIAERAPAAQSDAYFASRPRGSTIGCWASRQSEPLGSREELLKRVTELEAKFEGQDPVPRPDHWGGFNITPLRFEFWEDKPDRVHDRVVYQRESPSSEEWSLSLLQP